MEDEAVDGDGFNFFRCPYAGNSFQNTISITETNCDPASGPTNQSTHIFSPCIFAAGAVLVTLVRIPRYG